jgi:hypothetical protein
MYWIQNKKSTSSRSRGLESNGWFEDLNLCCVLIEHDNYIGVFNVQM